MSAVTSRIEVDPGELAETAHRLRCAAIEVRRVRERLAAAGPAVTGSSGLSAALREHADAWGWSLERMKERAEGAAAALDAAAEAYRRVERSIAGGCAPR
jgi:hypothetical protein